MGREDQGGYADMKRRVLSFDLNWDMESMLRVSGGIASQSRGAEWLKAVAYRQPDKLHNIASARAFISGQWALSQLCKLTPPP